MRPVDVFLRFWVPILVTLILAVIMGKEIFKAARVWNETLPYECQEDMPCWDCKTMGNEICGEDITKIIQSHTHANGCLLFTYNEIHGKELGDPGDGEFYCPR